MLIETRGPAWAALILSLAGCAPAVQYRSYSALHANYEQSAAPPERDAAALDAAAVLERDRFVAAVLARNPTCEAARAGWRAAIARVRQAGAFEDPMLELGVAPLSIAAGTRVGYEAGISQRLAWFGQRALASAAASAEADASQHDFEAVRRELALAALALYAEYCVAVRALAINAEHVGLLHALHAAALAQLESGRATPEEALEAEAELARGERDATRLASERQVVIAQMNELLHRAPAAHLPPPQSLPLPLPLPDSDHEPLAALGADAIAHDPMIAAARMRARGAATQAQRAERESYPDVTLSTSYSSMWDMPQHRWLLGLALNLPIGSSRREGAADEARALGARLEHEAERMGDAARTRVFVLWTRLQQARSAAVSFATKSLPLARDRVAAAHAGFSAGRTSLSAVLGAARNLRGVELEAHSALVEVNRLVAELELARGRVPGDTVTGAAP